MRKLIVVLALMVSGTSSFAQGHGGHSSGHSWGGGFHGGGSSSGHWFSGGAPTVATTATLAVMAAATTGTAGAAMEADGTVDTAVSVLALAGIVLGILGEVTIPDITITDIMATPITDIIPTPTVLTRMLHTEGAWPHIFAGEGTGGMGPGGIFMHRPESMRPREFLHQPELLRLREFLRLRKFSPLMVNGTALVTDTRKV